MLDFHQKLIFTTRHSYESNGVYFISPTIIVFSQSRYKGYATIVKVTPHTTETSIRVTLGPGHQNTLQLGYIPRRFASHFHVLPKVPAPLRLQCPISRRKTS